MAPAPLDPGALVSAPATVSDRVNRLLSTLARVAGELSVLDWVLIAAAALAIAWGWLWAASAARLGSIEIGEFTADGDGLAPEEMRAELRRRLGERGLLPPSRVPAGSPTKDDISDAVSESPLPQAAFVSALIKLIPLPPRSMAFTITGTLSATLDSEDGPLALLYQLVAKGPPVAVALGRSTGAGWGEVIDRAAKEIYREIAKKAPGVYPPWARWRSREALDRFAQALEVEHADDPACAVSPVYRRSGFERAAELYRSASELDPDNMLARLRTANCLERTVGELEGDARITRRIDALEEYVSIRARHPTIFSAGYRASLLLSNLADETTLRADAPRPSPHRRPHRDRLAVVLRRLEQAETAPGRRLRWRSATTPLRTAGRLIGGVGSIAEPDPLVAALNRAAARESRRARHHLRPFWTIVHEQRFRHRFEPTGAERRKLRKGLGVSKMCIRVRRRRDMSRRSAPVSALTQWSWEAFIWIRYMLGRQYVAGWQAQYNAACFYALLPKAADDGIAFGGVRRRRLALRHLTKAIEQAGGGELDCGYVRDTDPDLVLLRDERYRTDFERVLKPLCLEELVVHFPELAADPSWRLHVWGGALAPSLTPRWSQPTLPSGPTHSEPVFRIRIFDENQSLAILAHRGAAKAKPVWTLVPAAYSGQVWLYPSDSTVYDSQPSAPVGRR